MRGPKAQTIFGTLSRRSLGDLEQRAESRIVRTDASTSVRVELDRPNRPARSALVLLHGLAGSSESRYVLGTARKARDAGFLAARMNARNCGGTEQLTSEPYNGEETDDLEAVARELLKRDGVQRVHLLGFSVGGNQVLRLTARWGHEAPEWLGSVSLVSPCLDFAAAADGLQRSLFRRTVQSYFLDGLKEIVRRRAELDAGVELAGLDSIQSIRAFDDRYTAPLSGYRDADEYYASASMRGRWNEIGTPTLVVASRDDPLVPFTCFDGLDGTDAPVRLLATHEGGHVGFVGRATPAPVRGWRDSDRRWAENRVLQFASACDRV